MIIKILPRKTKRSVGILINYILNDKDRVRSEEDGGFVITHNLKGETISDWKDEVLKNEALRLYRRKGVEHNIITHEILSFSRDDHKNVTPEILRSIAEEYINLRGRQAMYVIAPHYNTKSLHLHCMVSGLEIESGLSMRQSWLELKDMRLSLQEFHLERFKEITHSAPDHGSRKTRTITDNEYQLIKRTGKLSAKQEILQNLHLWMGQSNSQSEFFERLKEQNFKTYVRGGKITGIVSEQGRKYRFKTMGIDINELEQVHKKEISKQSDEIKRKRELIDFESIRNRAKVREVELEPDTGENIASIDIERD